MTEHLRILFVTDAFPPHCYGSGWSAYHLARGLRQQGHDVRIIVAQPVRKLARDTYDDFSVYRVTGDDAGINPAIFSLSALGPGRAVHEMLQSWAPHVIHAQHVNAAAVTARVASKIPVVITLRDHWPICFYGTGLSHEPCPTCLCGTRSPCNDRRGSEDAPAALRVAKAHVMRHILNHRQAQLREASGVIAVSDAIADEVRPLLGDDAVRVVPNAVDVTTIPVDGHTKRSHAPAGAYFFYAGKLSAHKGADLLLDIVARLGDDAPPLLIAGSGPDEELLKAFDPTGQHVRVLGVVPNGDVLELMRRAIALVTPARWDEPLSRTHLEALAVGCPIVATETGGTKTIVLDGETGFLVPRGDTAMMAARLTEIATAPSLRRRLSAASIRHSVANFSLTAVTERTVGVYQRAIETFATQT
jgi:glycogen(starch) synthase